MYLATPLYRAEQVKQGEVQAAKLAGIEMYQLMLSAGHSVFELLVEKYSKQSKLLILCGGGNNGGDGYVVAKLALQHGMDVTVKALKQPNELTGDAQTAYQEFLQAGGEIAESELIDSKTLAERFDVVVDALLGTGLSGEVRGDIAKQIEQLNRAHLPVVAVDVPSGLCSNTGRVLGVAVNTSHTLTFIGIKQGLVTGQARNVTGQLHYAGLGVQQEFGNLDAASAYYDLPSLVEQLKPRAACAHKGSQGKALLIGGEQGLGGAILIASRACLKTGAGLTACLTNQSNIIAGLVSSPEVMFSPWALSQFEQRLEWCSAFALGPGLGQSEHAAKLFSRLQTSDKPKVLDADALTLLANQQNVDPQRIITPHPGEAARLLDCTITRVEDDRYNAVQALQRQYGGVAVLKGAGTLICDGVNTYVCSAGNAGMATGGMGDALTGVIVSLLAQGLGVSMAARMGVMLHSYAADLNVQQHGMVGLSASDVVDSLRLVINGRNFDI